TDSPAGLGQQPGGAKPGEVGAGVFAQSFASSLVNQYTLTVPITSLTVHDVGYTQKFLVWARFHGTCPDGSFAFAATIPKLVSIIHPLPNGEVAFAFLDFGGPSLQPVAVPVPLIGNQGSPIAYVTFANNQPTPGRIYAARVRNQNPFGFPQTGTLQG